MKTLVKQTLYPFGKVWQRYQLLVENAIQGTTYSDKATMSNWQETLFTKCLLYSLPASLLALIPSLFIMIRSGHTLICVYDLLAISSITLITLNKRLSLSFRKVFVAVVLYLLAIILIAAIGSFGIGSIYILAVSVYIALHFPNRIAYQSVAINVIIYSSFGLVIYFKLFNSPLILHYSLDYWIAYTSNLIFLNIVAVVQIRHVINGLENTIKKESRLFRKLKAEMAEKVKRNEQLKESEHHYRSLFFHNPSPMWIFDSNTLNFLQINDAAIRKYGYTNEEFLGMTIKDIRPQETVINLLDLLQKANDDFNELQSTVQHQGKNGEIFYVEVKCSSIPFQGKQARLVIARDITAHIQHTKDIEIQNNKLREIAYMQSHVVRAPLARIMGLSEIISRDTSEMPDKQALNYLDISVKELDAVIKAIVNNSDVITQSTSNDLY